MKLLSFFASVGFGLWAFTLFIAALGSLFAGSLAVGIGYLIVSYLVAHVAVICFGLAA
jgi:hypothetical protein